MNRRNVLQAAAGAVLLGSAPGGWARRTACARPFFARHGLPIGVQLYTIDPDLERDFDSTLRALRKIGFRTVELAGFHGRTAAQVKRSLDRAGLTCTSAHISPEPNGGGPSFADVGALAADMHTIGVQDVVLPIPLFPTIDVPAGLDGGEAFRRRGTALSAANWSSTAAFLNRKADELKTHGLRVSYHNHNFEFLRHSNGLTGLDILLRETDPRLVSFELDIGWVVAGGLDPLAILRSLQGRVTQVHVKDVKASTRPNFEVRQDATEVGRGKIDWARILPVAWDAGVRHFYVEQEPPFPGPRLESVAASFRYLSNLCAKQDLGMTHGKHSPS